MVGFSISRFYCRVLFVLWSVLLGTWLSSPASWWVSERTVVAPHHPHKGRRPCHLNLEKIDVGVAHGPNFACVNMVRIKFCACGTSQLFQCWQDHPSGKSTVEQPWGVRAKMSKKYQAPEAVTGWLTFIFPMGILYIVSMIVLLS